MQECELVELVYKIRHEKCEGQRFEVKSASNGCPKRLYDTLSSFSNQNTGGTIVFGIDEESGFAVSGVYDVQDLQQRKCRQSSVRFSRPPRSTAKWSFPLKSPRRNLRSVPYSIAEEDASAVRSSAWAMRMNQ